MHVEMRTVADRGWRSIDSCHCRGLARSDQICHIGLMGIPVVLISQFFHLARVGRQQKRSAAGWVCALAVSPDAIVTARSCYLTSPPLSDADMRDRLTATWDKYTEVDAHSRCGPKKKQVPLCVHPSLSLWSSPPGRVPSWEQVLCEIWRHEDHPSSLSVADART
jgi:hypothetical protein